MSQMPERSGLNALNSTSPQNNGYRNTYYMPSPVINSDIAVQGMKSSGTSAHVPVRVQSLKGGADASSIHDQMSVLSLMPRNDLIPLSDEVPADGIIFARVKNSSSPQILSSDTLVVFRTAEERLRNPERLNLDRRQLEFCPLVEHEQRLRLLDYQNNNIKFISNLENLPNLIFLDFYNNKIVMLDGPLNQVHGLRVLMAGKNKITKINNLLTLKKLDVLDLHSNAIKCIEGLDGLSDLRVLNLAGIVALPDTTYSAL
jgi:Leucine-rich repeat (LRR) protein